MTNFAVLHITKYQQLDALDCNRPTANLDPAKRQELSGPMQESLAEAIERRIGQGYTKQKAIRKDAVKALSVIMTGSHKRIKEIEANEQLFKAWKKANYDFACREFGKENIVRFTLHRDKKKPYFHCVFVPITKDGKLSARYFIHGSAKFSTYQDIYMSAMEPFGLARGIYKEPTNREHITTRESYKSVNKNTREAESLIKEINRSTDTTEKVTQAKYLCTIKQNVIQGNHKLAFQRSLEEANKGAYEWVKREIPLIDFAISKLGWQFIKNKSTKRDVVLEHPNHGRIIVPTRPKSSTGHWVYSLSNQKGGGTLIDLLRKEQWSWQKIKGLASSSISIPAADSLHDHRATSSTPSISDPQQQKILASQQLHEMNNTEEDTYLTRRGIQAGTYQAFDQLSVSQNKAIFGLYKDFDKERKGRLCSTISYYFDRFGEHHKYFQKDLPRGLAVLQGSKPAKTIVVTESPIDALSYRQLQLAKDQAIEPAMYVSTCGSLSSGIQEDLESLFETARWEGQQVVLALDNDKAGRHMTKKLKQLLGAQGCGYIVASPTLGKDWNECLTQPKEEFTTSQ